VLTDERGDPGSGAGASGRGRPVAGRIRAVAVAVHGRGSRRVTRVRRRAGPPGRESSVAPAHGLV